MSLPASIDLVQWLRLRSRCSAGMARKILVNGCLTVDGEVIGRRFIGDFPSGKWVAEPLVPADYRGRIVVGKGDLDG